MRQSLLPGAAERDEAFRHEIERIAASGLRNMGAVQIAVSVFLLIARWFMEPAMVALPVRLKQAGLIVALGLVNIALSRLRGAAPWARPAALLSAFLTCAILIWASMVVSSQSTNPNDFIPGEITLVMLVAVAIEPLRPLQTLALGLGILAEYIVSARLAEEWLMEGLGPDVNYIVFIVMLTLLSAGISAVLYDGRRANHAVLQQTIEAAEALRQAQTRILQAENATSLNRLAAAITHEMNTPLGALLSGVETLLLLSSRSAAPETGDHARRVQLQEDVRRSVQQSAERIKGLIGRLQRFNVLDEAGIQPSDVNALLEDAVILAGPDTALDLRFSPVPPVVCRPQQLTAVFSSLVSNAVQAVNGSGRVLIATRQSEGEVEIEIKDNGRGMNAAQLEHIFDPDFRVSGGRMAAGNWSMFSSRQIVREHGGDIRISSREGEGTRVVVTLPLPENPQSLRAETRV